MKFLKLFWKTLREYIHKLTYGKKKPNAKDALGRYLTSSSHFSKEKKRVKYTALMPLLNSKTKEFETSVFNIQGLETEEIKKLARKYILPRLRKNRSIYGTSVTDKMQLLHVGLNAEVSEPPRRHLNIIGWPEEKSKRKQLAMELATLCELSLFDDNLSK